MGIHEIVRNNSISTFAITYSIRLFFIIFSFYVDKYCFDNGKDNVSW
ncbi:hypothetical protein M088_5402 [Bacteroides ovatus str. 3725 D1 iv]|nr:hypothetical protein M088_5402 [Bacteroides ovatus str. 3725 D1 iv]